uniref:GATA zinc finger domain-containing protein 1 n=1 Tax=Plectus sambesii TaxID=2011161 RepID=A0A914WEV1_9BILA
MSTYKKRKNRTTWKTKYLTDEKGKNGDDDKKADAVAERPTSNMKRQKKTMEVKPTDEAIGPRRASSRHVMRQVLTAAGMIADGGRSTKALPLKATAKTTNRRSATFKSTRPVKAPTRRATVSTSDSVWHLDRRFSIGDIVSVQDVDDGLLYFAQVRGLLTDPYCEKFAALTWLVPTEAAVDPNQFEPEAFVHAIIDESLYNLQHVDFVTRRPTLAHYRSPWTPYSSLRSTVKDELNHRVNDSSAV